MRRLALFIFPLLAIYALSLGFANAQRFAQLSLVLPGNLFGHSAFPKSQGKLAHSFPVSAQRLWNHDNVRNPRTLANYQQVLSAKVDEAQVPVMQVHSSIHEGHTIGHSGPLAAIALFLGLATVLFRRSFNTSSAHFEGLMLPLLSRGTPLKSIAMSTVTGESIGSRTRQVMTEMSNKMQQQVGGAGGSTTYEALQRADQAWKALREMPVGDAAGPPPQFLRQNEKPLGTAATYDVVICGGTLGILAACALQKKGLRVAIVEQGILRGRDQEWNVSRAEMEELGAMGLLTEDEINSIIRIEFNPMRCGFHKGPDLFIRDVLNLGVSPVKLIEILRERFEELGGTVFERTSLAGVEVHPDGVQLNTRGTQEMALTTRLLLDCMGFASPIVRQARWGMKPDGVCMVVGTLGRGYSPENNTSGDLIYTCSPINKDAKGTLQGQYFWEAFPASTGPSDRTTYMFTYLDASPHRPSLEQMFEDYWELLPSYQNIQLKDIEILRCLFGFFPTYRNSPLHPISDRVMQIGDASGIQSPLSFGGFGAMIRHLGRLSDGISSALAADALDASSLRGLNPYMPNLSASWLFQRAMSVPLGAKPDIDFINRLLSTNFAVMQRLGDPVLKPFLQDVVQFGPLLQTLIGMVTNDPIFAVLVLWQIGPGAVADWLRHFLTLGAYDALHRGARGPLEAVSSLPVLTEKQRLQLQLTMAGWQYGSGNDYTSARKNEAASN